MKLLLENWRQYLNEKKEDDFVWHGSPTKFDGPVKPSQARDVGGHTEQNLKAVYATEDKNLAIAAGLVERDEDGNWPMVFTDANEKPTQMVVIKGKIREGKKVYLYKLTKDTFRNTGVPEGNPEWVSEIPANPVEVEEVSVDDHLHLIRKATPEDIKFWNKHAPEEERVQSEDDHEA